MKKTDLVALVMDSRRFFVTLSMVLLFSSSLVIPTANSSGSAVSYPVHPQTIETGTVTITTANPGGRALSFEGISSVAKTNSASTWSADSSGALYYSTSNLPSVAAAIPSLWLDSSNRKRRTRSQIYIEILELMKQRGPMTPFEIALYARLNHKRTKECLEFLELRGYQQTVREEDDHKIVNVLTKEGAAFLERARALFQSRMPAPAGRSSSVATVDR